MARNDTRLDFSSATVAANLISLPIGLDRMKAKRTRLGFVHGESGISLGVQCPGGLFFSGFGQVSGGKGTARLVRLIRLAAQAENAASPGRLRDLGPSHFMKSRGVGGLLAPIAS
jgi:hypothetical protein